MIIKKINSIILAAVLLLSAFSVTADARGIGACTHMAQGRDIEKTVSAANEIKLPLIRDEIRWASVEPVRGQLSMPEYASFIDRANELGIKPLVILCYGNPIYSAGMPTEEEMKKGGAWDTALPVRDGNPETTEDDEYFDAYIRYVDFVSKELAGRVEAYEIWNEPDIKIFNAKDVSASGYTELLKESYKTIKKNDSDVTVIGGVLAESNDYFKDILKGGACEYMDALSFHYYLGKTSPEDGARKILDSYRKNMKKYGNADMSMWLTETGWANSNVDEATQAKYIVRNAIIYEDFLADNGIDGQYFSYELHDSKVTQEILGGAAYESSLGLLRGDYSLKPAAKAVGTYNRLTADKKFVSLTETRYGFFRTKSAYTAKFTSGNNIVYALWSDTPKETEITLPDTETVIYDLEGHVIERTLQGGTKQIKTTDSPVFIEFTANEEMNVNPTLCERIKAFFKKIIAFFKIGLC